MFFVTLTPTTHLEHRSPGVPVREVELGETLTLRGVDSLTLVSHPGQPPTIDGLAITPVARGLHRFVVQLGQSRCELAVFAYDAACTAWIPVVQRDGDPSPRSLEARRLVIRSLVQHLDSDGRFFDGTVASLHNRPLALFGA